MRAILQKPCFLPCFFCFLLYLVRILPFYPRQSKQKQNLQKRYSRWNSNENSPVYGRHNWRIPTAFPLRIVCVQAKKANFEVPFSSTSHLQSPLSSSPPLRSSPHIHKQLRGSDTRGDRFRGGRIAVSPSLLPRKKAR